MSEVATPPAGEPVVAPGNDAGAGGPAAGSLAWLLAGLTGAAGLIHVAMVPVHVGNRADAVAMALAAWAQLWVALALVLGRPRRGGILAALVVNAAAIGALVYARAVGLPFGAHAGEGGTFGLADGVTAGLEAGAVLLAGVMLVAGDRLRAPRLVPALGAVAVLGLATTVVMSPEAADHRHGAEGADGHEHATSAAAMAGDMAAVDADRCDQGFNPVAYWDEARLLGVDVYAGGSMSHHDDHGGSLMDEVRRPGPNGGRGSETLDQLIALTGGAASSEVAAAQLISKLAEVTQEDYDTWLAWMRDHQSIGHSHAAGAGDDTGGHGGHAGPQPWKAMVDPAECEQLAEELELARATALKYPTVKDAEAAGWVKVTPYLPGIAAHYMNFGLVDGRFEIEKPEMLLYDGTDPGSHIVGLSYYLRHNGELEPTQGFTGGNDHFHRHIGLCVGAGGVIGDSQTTAEECAARGGRKSNGSNGWMSHAWVVPGCESPWGVFSAASPLLDPALSKASPSGGPGCAASSVRDRYDLSSGTADTLGAPPRPLAVAGA